MTAHKILLKFKVPHRFQNAVGITLLNVVPSCYTSGMDDIANATNHDEPRQVATGRDLDYTLSIEEVSERYASAGHARKIRTLQRYCASGHLDAQKIATTTGDKYLVTPQSVARHLAQIDELQALDTIAVSRDQ